MKTFKQYIKESPMVVLDDYKSNLKYMDKEYLDEYSYFLLDTLTFHDKKFYLYESNEDVFDYSYLLIEKLSETNYQSVALLQADELSSKLPYSNLLEVAFVKVSDDYQRMGIAKMLYKYLSENFNLMSDKYQYFGSRKLWSSLSREINYSVDVVDISTDKVLEKNVSISHGQLPLEYDTRYWSQDENKNSIRFILRKVQI